MVFHRKLEDPHDPEFYQGVGPLASVIVLTQVWSKTKPRILAKGYCTLSPYQGFSNIEVPRF